MVAYDALTASQRRDYAETVAGSHRRRVELEILTLEDKPVRSLTGVHFLGGSIQGDDSRTPVEVFEATVLDDDYVLDWHHGQHRRYKARVVDSRFVPALDDWVDAVAFTGPLWDFERQGPVVSLVAQGSERLAMGSVRNPFQRPRKSKATAVVRDMLKATGAPDRGIRVPGLAARLPEAVTVGVRVGKRRDTNGKKKGQGKDNRPKTQIYKVDRSDHFWAECSRIVHALDRDLFADNHGRFVMAPPSTRPAGKLTPSTILSPVKVKRGTDGEVTNTWVVMGANPKGPKKQVKVEVALPRKHPLSAQSLSWHGTAYEITETIENKNLKTRAQAVKVGVRRRDQATRELVTYEVEAVPVVPWIRPGALWSVTLPGGGKVQVRVHQWTIPLGPDASPMTLGANRRTGWGR